MKITVASLLVITLLLAGCDKGLAPPPPAPPGKPFISGKVIFTGTWPPVDSVKHLVLVLIPGYPPYHVDSLIGKVLNGSVLSVLLNYKNSDTTFRFDKLLDGTRYGYLGVAQQFSDSIFRDWRAVGFWHDTRDSALSFTANIGDSVTDATVRVNFDSLPWPPFIP
jgi:hypothetical protein